ncbi:hypothetical protein GF336_06725 [Candidatus Woesearchaeota archaeon]|nr:hypothetical protein [Candidatus Woesearchaeota archaeon]
MKKKGSLVVFSVILILLFLTACQRQPSPEAEDGSRNVYYGTEGLDMEFENDLPPSKIYDESSLNILLNLRNKGTHDLSGANCRLYLSGYDQNIIRGIDRDKECGQLEPKSTFNPEGGYATQEFNSDIVSLPDYMDSIDQTFLLTSCYEYETAASPVVCIDPRLYEITPTERVCDVRDVSLGGGQGAPVAVTNVGVTMAGKNRVAFKIKVSNVGGGTPFYYGQSIFNCPTNLLPEDYNIIAYDVDMSGASRIKCSPTMGGGQQVKLNNGQGTIYCTFNIAGDSAYTTPLRITLYYNYMDSISEDVEIIKTPE